MLLKWTGQNLDSLPFIFLSGILIFIIIIILNRITGLRSFAKMSASDFVITLAIGSTFASIITQPKPNIINGGIALIFLFLVQSLAAFLKRKWNFFDDLQSNTPVLLMKNGKFIEKNLIKTNVSHNDIVAKLREANALNFRLVHAVVFETTGDISVLHGEIDGELDSFLLEGVQQ